MIRSLYARAMQLASHPRSTLWLAIVSFTESIFVPLPPDFLLVPMVLARPEKAWFYASLVTVTSTIGGIAGYAIGYFLFELAARPILTFYGLEGAFESLRAQLEQHSTWATVVAGISPIVPYKLITLTSGALGFPLLTFLCISILSRGTRFFIVCGLTRYFGYQANKLISLTLWLVLIAFLLYWFLH